MEISVSLVVVWFIGCFLYFVRKKLSFLINGIVFMIMVILIRNFDTTMIMQLKKISAPEDSFSNLFFLIHREAISPFLLLIFVNVFATCVGWVKKLFLLLIILTCMQAMDVLSLYFKVTKFIEWSYIQEFIIHLLYLSVALSLSKILLYIESKGESLNESSV
jgi:hypothetical protein